MKILFVTDGLFPFVIGGMQKHSTLLINELARKGCSLTVIHPGGKDFSEAVLESVFSEYSTIEFILVPFPKFMKFPGHYIRENKAYSKQAFEILKSRLNLYDIIYCQGLTGYFFVTQKVNTIPVIINLHGYGEFFAPPSFKLKLQYAMLRPVMREISLNADYIYSFGGKITDLLVGIGIERSRILYQFNGVANSCILPLVRPRKQEVTKFVYIGRNERRKGIEEIVSAVKELNLKSAEKFEFHFIGETTKEIQIEAKNVFLHGQKTDINEIFSIIDGLDCVVLPSYAEGMPLVLIEAMARGLAVIASDVGATRELIHNNGILLNSPKDLLCAMKKILSTPESEFTAMKKNSLKIVNEKYNLPNMIDSILNDMNRAINRRLT